MTKVLTSADFLEHYLKLPKPDDVSLDEWLVRIEEAADLSLMCGFYPGDVGGGIQKEICRLLNQEYVETEGTVAYE